MNNIPRVLLFGLAIFVVWSLSAPYLFPPVFYYAPPLESGQAVLNPVSWGQPVRFRIPALALDSEIEQVGRTASGFMAVPKDYRRVGWFKEGIYPGQTGNAVFAGHLDNALGFPGAFSKLHQLQIGDEVSVIAADGVQLEFVVVKKEIYNYRDAPLQEIFGPHERRRLNLITCDGAWLKDLKTYDKRLVVFTELKNVVVKAPAPV